MFSYTLIRSRRRSAALEITRDCRVVLRAPLRLSQKQIDAFAAAHEDWVRVHLERQRARQAAAPPPPTPEEIAALKARAREVLPSRVEYFAKRMGLTPAGVKITAARTRYGSCSGKNSLCFSCFLMSCPPEAIDLVVVHELCHIRHHNHGPRFYALLSSVLPDYQARGKLLTMPQSSKKEGTPL